MSTVDTISVPESNAAAPVRSNTSNHTSGPTIGNQPRYDASPGLGETLRAFRERRRVSQTKLARRAGYKTPVIRGKSAIIEGNERQNAPAVLVTPRGATWKVVAPMRRYRSIPPLTTEDRERFMRLVDRQPNGCWYWQGTIDNRGYGVFMIQGKAYRATRVSLVFTGVPIDGLYACHRCDTTQCVNPDHLFAGTQSDNMADCVAKGRKERGSASAMAKLTEAQVLELRQRYANYERLADLAESYDISPVTVSQIARGQTWRHVGGPIGRPPRSGMHNPQAKLTDRAKQDIVDRYFAGRVTQQQLADEYGVCFQRISEIVRAAKGSAT